MLSSDKLNLDRFTMQTTLLIFVHPAFEKSQANRRLIDSLGPREGLTIHDLYEAYPNFHINVAAEQALLESHARILFQFPLYWYSTPSLLKEWFDLVLEYGWAYGKGGDALNGKTAQVITTAGGSADAYSIGGSNGYTIPELLRPIERTAILCGMQWIDPCVIYGSMHLDPEAMKSATKRYRSCLMGE